MVNTIGVKKSAAVTTAIKVKHILETIVLFLNFFFILPLSPFRNGFQPKTSVR